MNPNVLNDRMRDLARQLLAFETAALSSAESDMPAAGRVCEALRRPLCTLAGTSGYRALLTRALSLGIARVHGLNVVRVSPDGSLEGISEIATDEAEEAGVVLISQLLGLLAGFIGESLTLSILVEVWPDVKRFQSGTDWRERT
jgi:hypothetical protein